MSFEVSGARARDDVPCRYGASKLLVRGPQRTLDEPYVAFLGSSDTYGKFVKYPFTALTEKVLDLPCVNFGCTNAGVDAFVNDAEMTALARAAQVTVLQVMGAQNLSNRFYRVHPRRNDRFLCATPLLKAIFGEVDFTEFHFNKHLLTSLHKLSPDRFVAVRQELQTAWLARMRLLLDRTGPKTLLLWVRHSDPENDRGNSPLGANPLMVTRKMLDQLSPGIVGIIEVPVKTAGPSGDLENMLFGSLQAPIAERSLGPGAHALIAEKVARAVRPLL